MKNENLLKKIEVSELKSLMLSVFDNIFNDIGLDKTLTIDQDFYWNINYQDFFDIANLPNELTIGSLYDDIVELEKFNKNEASTVTNVHIRKLTGLIMFLALQKS